MVSLLFTILFLFGVPFVLNKVLGFVEAHIFRHLSKKVIVFFLIGGTLLIEVLLSWILAERLDWDFIEAHFTIGFLMFILVWFMQFNEWLGNKYANVDN
ncbi:hypothetical protein [Halobacillus salinus]|uniref:hypothetical protein n=1 Tax=Halobacillus salinus TaxID=192814 RepID=UPI0009A774EF|nr:hypothetical protein [Halobacillus salinus]